MTRILRLLILAAIALFAVYSAQLLRQIMATELTYQSFWHYLVRVLLILAAGIAGVLLLGRFSVYNPSEVIGTPPTPEVGFKYSNFAKRLTDVLVAVFLLLSPILLVIPLLIFIIEGYPFFYVSKRYISLSNCVSVLKFRTMVRDATSPKYQLRERFMRSGYLDIPLSCEVYTPLGRILERTQLVEILQLFNILLHGMSLIGNRPLPLDNIKLLQQFEGWEHRFDSPAGLTGITQVVGKLNQTPEQRLELECMYSKLYKTDGANIFWCDLCIAYYTVRMLITGKTLPITEAHKLIQSAFPK
jgi:lipopolysaccharide/colanic/teichoic acid biosynthesis glycosyltransferase